MTDATSLDSVPQVMVAARIPDAMLKVRAVALAIALLASGAAAQEPSPVIAYFQQYNSALERGDIAAAESAAASALAASQQRDGNAGRTPILALNLGRVRIQLGQWQDAGAPARLAYDLSRSSGASEVDQGMSGLLWSRVRLANEGFDASGFVVEMLERTKDRTDLLGDRYDAAEQLGLWAMQTRNFLIARRAWTHAQDAAAGASIPAEFARGRALAFEGVSIAMLSLTREVFMPLRTARAIRERLTEAHALVRPFAFADLPPEALATTQSVYAQILAWDAAIWSKLVADDPTMRGRDRLDANPQSIDGIPVCAVRPLDGSNLSYPARSAREGQLAGVVIGLRFDEQGTYQGADVLAAVGDEEFTRHMTETISGWAFATEASEGCRSTPLRFVAISFSQR